MASVRYSFTLDAIQDARYVKWLGTQANLSAAVRAAIVAYVDRPSHKDLDDKLDRLLDALRNVQVVGASVALTEQGHESEPARAKAGLANMLKKFRGS